MKKQQKVTYKKPDELCLMDRIFFKREPYEVRAIVEIQKGKTCFIYNVFLRDGNGEIQEVAFSADAKLRLVRGY